MRCERSFFVGFGRGRSKVKLTANLIGGHRIGLSQHSVIVKPPIYVLFPDRVSGTGSKNSALPVMRWPGRMLVDAMARSAGCKLKVKGFSWTMVRLLGLAWPQLREVAEMS